MLGRNELKPFHLERWDLAHRATDYTKWSTADEYYDIQYEHVRPGKRAQACRAPHRRPSAQDVFVIVSQLSGS